MNSVISGNTALGYRNSGSGHGGEGGGFYIDPNFYNAQVNVIILKEVSFTKASDKLSGFASSCKSQTGHLLGDGGLLSCLKP